MERLIYRGVRRIPYIFTEEEVMRIITYPLTSHNYFSREEQKEWGRFFRLRDMCLLATTYILGLRPKCACCLRFDDFDFKRATVKIRGENNKVRKDRLLPLPSNLLKFYRSYLQYPRARFWKGSKYLFPSFSHEHIGPHHFERVLREKILKPLGIWEAPIDSKKSKYCAYTLRHSRASHLWNRRKEKNIELLDISNFLGHSDLRSTQIYVHTDNEYREFIRDMIS